MQETANLARMFQYVIDVCKFNAKIFTDDDLDLLLRRAVAICKGTTHESDMRNCITLFDTIITYVHIPTKSLRSCLEILCEIHKRITDLQDHAWNTLTHLFKSHVGQAAISALLHILLDGPTQQMLEGPERERGRRFSLYRGTTQVLQLLLFENGRNGLPKVPMSLLFPALRASIKEPHHTQEEIVISLIDTVLSQESMRDLLLAETDFGELLEIIHTCAQRDNDRYRARRTSASNDAATSKIDELSCNGVYAF